MKSQRGTQFRIWATSILKEYLVRGAALNQRRLEEKGAEELRGVLALLAETLEPWQLVNDTGLAVLLGAIEQTCGGQNLYPAIEDKAVHLLCFVIKDHTFTDVNKRIGSFLFLHYLQTGGMMDAVRINNKGLVALALLIGAGDPAQKELIIRLIVNLLGEHFLAPTNGAAHG